MQTSDVDQVIILNPDTDVMALDSIYLIHLKKAVAWTAENQINMLLTYFFLKLIL